MEAERQRRTLIFFVLSLSFMMNLFVMIVATKCLAERPKKSSVLLVCYLACDLSIWPSLVDSLWPFVPTDTEDTIALLKMFQSVLECLQNPLMLRGYQKPLKASLNWPSARPFFCFSKIAFLSFQIISTAFTTIFPVSQFPCFYIFCLFNFSTTFDHRNLLQKQRGGHCRKKLFITVIVHKTLQI